VRHFANLCLTELRRTFVMAWSYRLDLVGDQVLFILGFLFVTGLFEVTTDGRYSPEATLASMIGWLTWRVAAGCMVDTTRAIATDAQTGTLEHLWLSGARPSAILSARSLTLVVYYSLRALVMAAILVPLLRLPVRPDPAGWAAALIVYLMTLAGAFGLVLVIAGLHLLYKNVSTITYALATSLLFLSGAIVSFEGIPLLYAISRFLPLSAGIDLLRSLLIAGQPRPDPADFALLILNSTVYLLAGLLTWSWAQKRALVDGSLAHY
jgi:ABC-2 type transport system permease protein